MLSINPCPFCGGRGALSKHAHWSERLGQADATRDYYYASCEACLARGPRSDDRGCDVSLARDEWLKGKAVGGWNKLACLEPANAVHPSTAYKERLALFFNKVAHGSAAHREWLCYEIEKYFAVELDRRLVGKALKEP